MSGQASIDPTQLEVPLDVTTVGEFDDVTPTDLAAPPGLGPQGRVPQRGHRKRLLSGEGGDFCIYVISEGEHGLPQGALVPVAGVPRFDSIKRAKSWLANQSGDLLANRQVMIFRAFELINVTVMQTHKISLIAKTKTVIVPTGQ